MVKGRHSFKHILILFIETVISIRTRFKTVISALMNNKESVRRIDTDCQGFLCYLEVKLRSGSGGYWCSPGA